MSPRTLAVTLMSASKSNLRWIFKLPFTSSPNNPNPSLLPSELPLLPLFPEPSAGRAEAAFATAPVALSGEARFLRSPLRPPGAFPADALLEKY